MGSPGYEKGTLTIWVDIREVYYFLVGMVCAKRGNIIVAPTQLHVLLKLNSLPVDGSLHVCSQSLNGCVLKRMVKWFWSPLGGLMGAVWCGMPWGGFVKTRRGRIKSGGFEIEIEIALTPLGPKMNSHRILCYCRHVYRNLCYFRYFLVNMTRNCLEKTCLRKRSREASIKNAI